MVLLFMLARLMTTASLEKVLLFLMVLTSVKEPLLLPVRLSPLVRQWEVVKCGLEFPLAKSVI